MRCDWVLGDLPFPPRMRKTEDSRKGSYSREGGGPNFRICGVFGIVALQTPR
jgi:hypothetical protein